jgi:hypothetical protein
MAYIADPSCGCHPTIYEMRDNPDAPLEVGTINLINDVMQHTWCPRHGWVDVANPQNDGGQT